MTSFGWGQRQCLGQSVTQDELIVACGALAWCFNLKRKRDTITGNDLPVPLDKCNSLLIIKPDPFQMKFEPRSEDRRREALRLWEEAEAKDRREKVEFLRAAPDGKNAQDRNGHAGAMWPFNNKDFGGDAEDCQHLSLR